MSGEREDIGGDPPCWLDRVCQNCGRFIEDEFAQACEHCGAARYDELPVAGQGPAGAGAGGRGSAGTGVGGRGPAPKGALGSVAPPQIS